MECGYTWITNQSPTLEGKEDARLLHKSGQGFANDGAGQSRAVLTKLKVVLSKKVGVEV